MHAFPSPFCLSLPILLERNAGVAIIKVGLAAASESGGQKGNKTSEIKGQLSEPRSNKNLRQYALINAAKYIVIDKFDAF